MGFHEWIQKSAAKGLAKQFVKFWHKSNGSSDLAQIKKLFVVYRKVYSPWWDNYDFNMHSLPEFLYIIMQQENKALDDDDEYILKNALRMKLDSLGVDMVHLI